MAFILNKKTGSTDAGRAQVGQIQTLRRVGLATNKHLATLANNVTVDLAPRAWLDMDQATGELIGQEADVLFTDLMALSRSINIGKLVSAYSRLGVMDQGETSLTGQLTHLMGQVSPSYDGVAVPVHTKAFGMQWREVEGKRSIGFDDIADNQAAAVREVMRLMTVNFMDGNPNINYQGFQAHGIRTNPNTLVVQLTADLTDPAATYAQLQSAFTAFVYSMRGGANRVTAAMTVYISPEIEQNLQRASGATTMDRTFYAALATTAGVAGIKTSYLLEGNEVLGMVLNRQFVQPVTGMAITTTPVPRLRPFDDYQWISWSASGLQIRADDEGRTGVVLGTS